MRCEPSHHVVWQSTGRGNRHFPMTGEWARNHPWPHQPQNPQKTHGVVQAIAGWRSAENHHHAFPAKVPSGDE